MTADKEEQLEVSRESTLNLENVIKRRYANLLSLSDPNIMSIIHCAIYLELTGEKYCDIIERLAKDIKQDKNNIERPRKYYSVHDLKNLNTITERLIDYLENYDLRIENATQIQAIVKQIVNDWISEGNMRKKINFN